MREAMTESEWFARATARVEADAELRFHREIVLADQDEADHWQWVATARKSEILQWVRDCR